MNEKNDFKQALKRTRVGERHEMETLPGYFFSPVKFSVEGSDAIKAVTAKNKDLLDAKSLKRIKEIAADEDGKRMDTAALLEKLSDEEFADIVHSLNASSLGSLELSRVKIKYGLGPNNLGAGVSTEGALVKGGVPDEFVEDVLQNAEIAEELVGVINIWNSPLAGKQQKTSRTAANGSTETRNSRKEQNGQTEPGPTK